MTKMTNVKALAIVLDTCELTDEVRAKIESIKASYEKKSSAEKKPTKTQIANDELKDKILNSMTFGERYTVTEILKGLDDDTLTNQKISALMRQLVADKVVDRIEDKRKTFFTLL